MFRSVLLIIFLLLTGCASTAVKESTIYRIPIPLTNYYFEFPSDNYEWIEKDENRPYYFLHNTLNGLIVSFNYEKALKCVSSESCRDYFAKK